MENEMNLYDKLAAVNKAIIGAIPYAGPALSEIICALIPNQRLDRAIRFLNTIAEKVEELSESIRADKEKISLIETGLRASANSTYKNKCEWTGNIVICGLSSKVEVPIAEELIEIVEELNREQIILLYYYCTYYHRSIVQKGQFMSRFQELFRLQNEFVRDTDERAMLESKRLLNHKKLATLGLIENDLRIPELPDYNISGTLRRDHLELLKRQIHELNKRIIEYNNSDKYRPTDLGKMVIDTMLIAEKSLQ